MWRALAITLAIFALLYGLTAMRYAPPDPLPRDAPKESFSAGRAHDVLERIAGDGKTRFVGTEGSSRARGVIVSELERLGWAVGTESAMSCTRYGTCAPVTNVVARLAGREPSLPGVLVTAHYDSVGAGPGVSDDGVGTAAVLETARALVEGPRPRRNVAVVVTDGEECGLLGADAFVRAHASDGDLRTTVNVDARGSRGPSFMFETSAGNAWLVSQMAASVDRPVTTSLYYEVYKRMPNDTDFSITKTIASGVNFANTGGIEHYHTPLDDLAHADPRTLQHQGDHVLSMTRALADAESSAKPSPEDAVWFDVLAFGIVRWPARSTPLIAFLVLALLVGQAVRARVFDRGLLAFLAAFPGVAAATALGLAMKALGAMPTLWIAHPGPLLVALHAGGGAAVLAVLFALAARASPRALWSGTWIGWAFIGTFAALRAPGGSYLVIVPAAVAVLASALPLGAACVVPATVAGVLVLSLSTSLYETLGLTMLPLLPLSTILLATTIAPMLSGISRDPSYARRAPIALAGVALVAAIVATTVPASSEDHPRRVNVVFHQDEASARVFVDTSWGFAAWGPPPSEMVAAIGGAASEAPALPWTPPARFADVPRLDLAPPSAEVVSSQAGSGGVRAIRVRLRSSRGAPSLAVVFPADYRGQVKVDGHTAMPRVTTGGRLLALLAVPPEGVNVDLEVGAPLEVTLLDRSPGAPPGTKAEAAVHARPRDAVPSQDGDTTVVSRKVAL